MDARERVMTALHGGEPDRIPCALGFFSQSLLGAADADEHFGTDVRFVDFAPPAAQDSFLEYLESLPPGVHVGSAAQLRTYHEWGYHPEGAGGAAGRTANGAGDLSPPEPPHGPRGVVDRIVRLLPKTDRPAAPRPTARPGGAAARAGTGLRRRFPSSPGGELFETAWRMRGFDRFMTDLVEAPDLVDYLLDQLAAMATVSARTRARRDGRADPRRRCGGQRGCS